MTWVSDGCHPLFADGIDPIGMPFHMLWHADSRSSIARAVALALQKGRSQIDCANRAGRRLDASIELRRDSQRLPVELIVSITDRGLMPATLCEQDAMLFEVVPLVMLISHDREARTIRGNMEAQRRYGTPDGANYSLSMPAALNLNFRLIRNGSPVEVSQLPMQRAGRGEDVRDEEYELHFTDGRVRHVILNAAPLRNKSREVIGSVCVETDITERKRLEVAQRLLLESSRASGQAFFDSLVGAITETLGACHAYLAELKTDSPVLHTLSARAGGEPRMHADFIPQRTPCEQVVKGEAVVIARDVRGLYPEAPTIQAMNAEAYIGIPLRGADGHVIGLIGVLFERPLADPRRAVDIVEIFAGKAAAEVQRMRIEQSLRQSEEEYRIITDAVPAVITFVDTDGRYRFANAALKNWIGVDPKDAKGKHISEVIGRSAYDSVKDRIDRALAGERQKFEVLVPYDTVAPKIVSAEYVPYLVDNEVRGFFAFLRDVSEQRAAAEALSKSEQQFRTLFEHLPVGVALTDIDGGAIVENDVFTRLLPPNETSRSVSRIFERIRALDDNGLPLPNAMHPLALALQGVVVRDVEVKCRHDAKTAAWVRMSAIPILGEKGQVTGALVVVADIEGEKRDEARRNLLINELNHRVKNTLASVQSIASQTFRSSILTEDGLAAFEDRLLALSNAHNLLTQEHWEGADLKRLATLALEPHDPGDGRLRVTGESVRLGPPAALAFAMALQELATNAVKYGALSVPRGRVELQWHVDVTADGRRLKVSWVENGGPPIRLPIKKGFGTRLIERSLAFELGSEASIRYEPQGVICEIDADMTEIAV